MDIEKEIYIYELRKKIKKYKKKCQKSKIEFFRTYYMGKLFIYQEVIRRLSGMKIEIVDAYFLYS